MITLVTVRTQFEAQHRWIDAPEVVSYLRSYHRHTFHVSVSMQVTQDDRQIEFYIFKEEVDEWLMRWAGRDLDLSCEQMARFIRNHFGAYSVTVQENDENEATVIAEPGDEMAKTIKEGE